MKQEVISNFNYEGTLVADSPFGNGHINDTYLLVFRLEDGSERKIILQRMNTSIFKEPVMVMENIMNVTAHLRNKIVEYGGDPERETLNVIPAKDGRPYFVDSEDEYWRSYIFVTDATSYDKVECPEDFYESAVAFGNFQRLLADFPAETLHETIPSFHDTLSLIHI